MNYDDLYKHRPCREGREWLAQQEREGRTLAQAWDKCPRGDWLAWALDETGNLPELLDLRIQLLVLDTPIGGGRTVLDRITDPRSLAFIALKRARLAGETISDEDWDAAWDAAWDAWNAAEDAAWTAVEAAAGDAARGAAWGAARAAGDAARNAAWNAARDAARLWQANAIRDIVPNPFEGGER